MHYDGGMTTYVGKCKTRGCKSRVRVDIPVSDATYANPMWLRPSVAPASFTAGAVRYGLVCAEHGTWVHVRPLQGHVVEGKRCDGRCTSATGPVCECECGGENHGRSFVTHA